MRITQRMMTNNAVQHMDENLRRLQALQEKAASGKEFRYASDDPAKATASLTLRSSLEANVAYLESANSAWDWMSSTDFSINQIIDMTTNALSLTQQGTSETLGAEERAALALELHGYLETAIDSGNTNHAGNYIYSGFKTTTVPFEKGLDVDGDGFFDSVDYHGDGGTILRNIAPGLSVAQNITGDASLSPVYAAMIAARDALNANDTSAIVTTSINLENALNQVLQASTMNGARMRQVTNLRESHENMQYEISKMLSQKEDANMAEAISSLTYQETVYQAVLEVGNRAISALSLFDILS